MSEVEPTIQYLHFAFTSFFSDTMRFSVFFCDAKVQLTLLRPCSHSNCKSQIEPESSYHLYVSDTQRNEARRDEASLVSEYIYL